MKLGYIIYTEGEKQWYYAVDEAYDEIYWSANMIDAKIFDSEEKATVIVNLKHGFIESTFLPDETIAISIAPVGVEGSVVFKKEQPIYTKQLTEEEIKIYAKGE